MDVSENNGPTVSVVRAGSGFATRLNRCGWPHASRALGSFGANVVFMLAGTALGQLASVLFSPALTRLYSPDQFITVAASDLAALLDVGYGQDVADVGQGEPRLLGEQDARDPVEVGAGVSAATSGRTRGREQAHGLPVAQYVRCQAEVPGHFADAHGRA